MLLLLLVSMSACSGHVREDRHKDVHKNAIVDLQCSEHAGLATVDQIELEKKVLEILANDKVAEGIENVKELYRNDPLGELPSGEKTLDHAALSIATAMAEWGALFSLGEPKVMWMAKAGHSWFGIEVPNSGYGIENPDNVYRHVAINGQGRYLIRGRMPERPPAQQTFILYRGLPGIGQMTQEGSPIVAVLDSVQVDEDGYFTVSIDPDPAGGRANHIQTTPDSALLIIRDSLSDWQKETPISLEVSRVDESGSASSTTKSGVEWTLELLGPASRFWLEWQHKVIFTRPVNEVPFPEVREGGWGLATGGQFDLDDDQALVVTLDPYGARYVGFQLTDVWGVALDYVKRTGSLSNFQVRRNGDGTITYAISATDPGIYNWLDTSGLSQGSFVIRWQDLKRIPDSIEGAVVSFDVVDVNDVARTADTVLRASNQDRKRQLEDRLRGFRHRVACSKAPGA